MKYLLLLLLGLLLFACETNSNTPSTQLSRVADEYIQHAFAQDYERLAALLAEDIQFVGPKVADTLDKPAVIASWRAFHTTYDTAYYEQQENYLIQTAAGPEVLYYYQGRFYNRDLGVWVTFPVHVRFQIQEKQIHRLQIFVNQADIQSQLGLGYRLKIEPHPATDSPPSDAYPQGE
ncbi:MAG: nuclear transport factor 2 family protein [Bacteroidota bacterium]